jgi:hypothetical protein
MPIKITNSYSSPEDGLISQDDVTRLLEDYRNDVVISSKSGRPVIKTVSVLFPVSQMQELVQNQDGKFLNIQFTLTLPDQKSCADNFQTDISNQLSVLINLATIEDEQLTDELNSDDFILTPGYKAFGGERILAPCCGNPRGGGGS